jgi:glucose-6-phosphate isomerase
MFITCKESREITPYLEAHKSQIERVLASRPQRDAMLGWFDVDTGCSQSDLERIEHLAMSVRQKAEILIVIGIGGSNRGAVAAIQALRRSITSPVKVVFAGDTLSTTRLSDVLHLVRDHSVMLNVIAKDFNTVEPGITFRMLRQEMIRTYGKDYASRIIVTGSKGDGQLFDLARKHGYEFLDFPKEIGGRFSVLSNVGLFPMAVAGIDIKSMLDGARKMSEQIKKTPLETNAAVWYAVRRMVLLEQGFSIESLVLFEPDLHAVSRWWIQLFAETEGKKDKVLFPVSFSYSEDLHAVGQFVQQGPRTIVETFLDFSYSPSTMVIAQSTEVADGFSYMDGRHFDELNRVVYNAALNAHAHDGVPCIELNVEQPINEYSLGALFWFFMCCAYMGATLLEVNPFNQDGVEAYKQHMYDNLGKFRQ